MSPRRSISLPMQRALGVAITAVVLCAAFVALLVPHPVEAFRILGPPGNQVATQAFAKLATAAPPFTHWDLREFPNCTVPWAAHEGTADIGGTGEFTGIANAFTAWQNVNPAIIAFSQQAALPAGPPCPLVMDGNNAFGWDGMNCGMPNDDTWNVAVPVAQRMCGGAVAANAVIVNGGDGWFGNPVNNCCDDFSGTLPGPQLAVSSGADGIIHTTPAGDDNWHPGVPVGQRMCGGVIAANTVIIVDPAPGMASDGMITPPNNCCDDMIAGNNIQDGGDGVVHTTVSTGALGAGTLGLTAVFHNPTSGVILESDVLFNDVSFMWQNVGHNAAMGGNPDVMTVAAHEIGHFLGLHHPPGMGNANPPGPIMNPFTNLMGNSNQMLANDDQDGLNWLYTPDLGDAPDPFKGFNKYQSLVHGLTNSRMLNGIQLTTPGLGAAHLFGWNGAAAGNTMLEFEWLGASIDNAATECESRQVDADMFDDGVVIPSPMSPVGTNEITVTINTSAQANRYAAANAQQRLYFNGYFDVDDSGQFDADERLIHWSGTPCVTSNNSANFKSIAAAGNGCTVKFDLELPEDPPHIFWCRFRVDYGEDEGRVIAHSPDLKPAAGAAQFGEVEDYRCTSGGGLAVELLSFEASESDAGVLLAWETASETDNLGFNVLRSTDPASGFAAVNPGLIFAQGGPAMGAAYEFLDDTVENGNTYYYLLQDIDTSGLATLHGAGACTVDVDAGCGALEVELAQSAPEFCAGFPIEGRGWQRFMAAIACVTADWNDNEDARFPRDCRIRRDRRTGDHHCVASRRAD